MPAHAKPAHLRRRRRKVWLSEDEFRRLPDAAQTHFSDWCRALIAPHLRPGKESIHLPPPGRAGPEGEIYTWLPNAKGTAGTLEIRSKDHAVALDLIGVDLLLQTDGSTVLRFSDRTTPRHIDTEE